MSIWKRIAAALAALAAGEGLAEVFDHLRTRPERSVAFTIAIIALGAKMAKADGRVTRDEVTAFREVFHIPPAEEANAAKVFNLARKDTAGFEDYARRIARMFRKGDAVLSDIVEGLFHVAVADGGYHPAEEAFLEQVAHIFELPPREFATIRARYVPGAHPSPWDVLGVEPGTPLAEVRTVWRNLVRETHPDRMIARGLPKEAVRLAEKRLVAINRAWEEIAAEPG